MNTETRISQHTAILLEHARSGGLTEEILINAIRSKDIAAFKSVEEEHYKYDDFLTYAEEHGEKLEESVLDGYRITFNTRNGLNIWLEQTFGLQSEVDFQVGEGIVEGLRLNEQQVKLIEQRLAFNWVVAVAQDIPGGKELTLKLHALADQ